MGSAYSIQRNRQGWIDPTDQDFTLKALMSTQERYNAGQAEVEAVVNNYKSLQVARGVDREYINKRVEALLADVNKFGQSNFASGAVNASIKNHMGQILDNNVMTAIAQTQKIQRYQSEVETIKEKKPELYNQLNESFGMAPAMDYLNSDELGATIKGNLTYIPFKDVDGEVQKTLLDIQQKSKDGVYSVPEIGPDGQPTGRMIQTTVNGKSQAELQDIALGILGDSYNDQLRVNVWGKTGGFKNVDSTLEQFYTGMESKYDQDILAYKTQLTSNKSEQQKSQIKDAIKQLENQRLNISAQKAQALQDPVSAMVNREKLSIASRMGNAMGLLQTKSVEYKKDDYFFANRQLELDYANFNLKTREFERSVAKDANELAMKQEELRLRAMGKSSSSTKDGKDGSGEGSDLDQWRSLDAQLGRDEEEKLRDDNQAAIDFSTEMWKNQTGIGREVMTTINDIARGVKGNTQQQNEAKILIQNLKNKGYSMNPQNERNVVAFMDMYSNANAYKSLEMLPMVGQMSYLGEYSNADNMKLAWMDIRNKWTNFNNAYKTLKANAQREEASGMKRAFTQNENFRAGLLQILPGITESKSMSKKITDDDISKIGAIFGDVNGTGVSTPLPLKNGSVSVRKQKDGNFALTYNSKGKDADKNGTMETHVIENIRPALLKSNYPELYAMSQNSNADFYSFGRIGTKQFISPELRYSSKNSEYYSGVVNTAKKIGVSETDLNLIDGDEAKDFIATTLGIRGLPNAELKTAATAVLNHLMSQEAMSKFKNAVSYTQSYDNSGEPDVLTSIVNNKGETLASIRGKGGNMESKLKLNSFAPQIIYSKIVASELQNYIQRYLTTGDTMPSESLRKLLENAR